ncbi:dihydrolipoyl dehydrogenase [Halobacterium wangiae]|uniref:dihydrolipoyl dehydrogenase n=1 Tax=Halobacterium wangiae TaxID=2902623 RepID=UPI001E4500AB|nr:dihydrolipoyl dehydrogenase [Halobacterium wangiae]
MVMGDIATGTDVLVVGGGPGGYVAAIRAAQHDLDTTLVERDAYGGTCLNYGCIPSKALITATDLAHDAGEAAEMGVVADPEIDMPAMADWKDGVVDQLTGGVEKLCKANGVNLVEGTAAFEDEHTARIAHGGSGQGMETIEFEHAIVATGSRAIEVPGFDFEDDPVWSSRDALDAEAVPDELVVVGAGYIGMELSTTFAKAGSDVTVVEMLDGALPTYEDDVTRVVTERAADLGIQFEFGEAASGWEETDGGIVVTTETEDGEESSYEADRVLVAVGREPVTDTLELEATGLEPNEAGFLETDGRARTDVDNIFAVGDVAGEPMLAHKASREGVVAAEVVAGEPAALDYQAVPSVVFTDPEIATVGMTEAEAADAGFDPVVGQMPFRASGRSLTTGNDEGFVRLVADGDDEFVLGAQIVGPEASELVAEVTLAIELGATLEDIARTIHTHPTLSEAVMEAAENARGQAIHTLNR